MKNQTVKHTKRDIQKRLSECAFNPREDGPMKIVCEISNLDYIEGRLREEVTTMNMHRMAGRHTEYQKSCDLIIRLAVLAGLHGLEV